LVAHIGERPDFQECLVDIAGEGQWRFELIFLDGCVGRKGCSTIPSEMSEHEHSVAGFLEIRKHFRGAHAEENLLLFSVLPEPSEPHLNAVLFDVMETIELDRVLKGQLIALDVVLAFEHHHTFRHHDIGFRLRVLLLDFLGDSGFLIDERSWTQVETDLGDLAIKVLVVLACMADGYLHVVSERLVEHL
jgi:hypothetical protein